MKRGAQKFLVSTTMLAVAACGGEQGKLEIRSTPTALAQGKKPVPYRIAEARGQLALGNAALALEAFRMAAREDPNSSDALAGMAACYDQMGRFDLSRRNYEAALALAPSDTDILGAFAGSLQLQGLNDEALSVRREIAARAASSVPSATVVAEAPAQRPQSPEHSAPPPQIAAAPVQVAVAPEPMLPARSWTAPIVNVSSPVVEHMGVDIARPETVRVDAIAEEVAPVSTTTPTVVAQVAPAAPKPVVQTAALGPSVTIKLPSVRRVQEAPAPAAPATPPTPVEPAKVAQSLPPLRPYARPVPMPTVTEDRGPYLERMSMGEIALITVAKPVWRSTTVASSDRSATVRFVPLRQANALPVKVRLLNAARVDRLAARTRTWLAARGWRGLTIGNSQATRSRSLILYPVAQRALALRLSAQFGFPLARRSTGAHVTILLGSDAANRRVQRSRHA
ncbi:MAG: hypothetical protein HOP96_06225 [Sphingomonas sp.]|nr:hypothetical protein [Sphingomonas sp.]